MKEIGVVYFVQNIAWGKTKNNLLSLLLHNKLA
jgi:hypothetical protein